MEDLLNLSRLERGRALPDGASAEVVFDPVDVEVAFGRSGAGGI